MAPIDKKLQEQLDLATKERKFIINLLEKLNIKSDTISENVNRMTTKVSDLSSKVDLDICTLNITSVNANKTAKASSSTDTKATPKLNVMTFFKQQFRTNPELIYDIVDEKSIDALFKANATEIKKMESKKADIAIYKSGLVYTNFIKGDKVKMALVKAKKEQYESRNTVIDSEITEHNIIDNNDEDIIDNNNDNDSDESDSS